MTRDVVVRSELAEHVQNMESSRDPGVTEIDARVNTFRRCGVAPLDSRRMSLDRDVTKNC